METYALFEDGTSDRIVFDFFTPDPKDDPVRLAFTDIDDIQVRNSAKNGCVAAYRILESLGYVQPGERFFLSCQFDDSKTGIKAQGASAGLAFALKFVQEVRRQHEEEPGCPLAATGEISNSSRTAAVERIDGINAKLAGALPHVAAGDKLLFPVANDSDVDPGIRERAADAGVQLRAVSTVEQAVKEILPQGERPKRTRAQRAWLRVAAVAAIVVIAAFVDFREGEPLDVDQVVAEATRLAEYGEYGKAFELMEKYVESGLPEDGRITNLKEDLTKPLEISVELHRMRSGAGVNGAALSVKDGDRIDVEAGSLYRFSYSVSDSCYAYAHEIDAEGRVLSLVGSEQWADKRAPGVSYYLPASPDQWLQIDGSGREEQVWFVVLRRRGRDLEASYGRARRDGSPGDGRLTQHLRSRMDRRLEDHLGRVGGVGAVEITVRAE